MKLSDLIISPLSIGKRLYLTDVRPAYRYDANRNRTNDIEGYRYTVAMADKAFDKLTVKIDGEQQLEVDEHNQMVTFEGLELYIYGFNGNYDVGARATAIHPLKSK